MHTEQVSFINNPTGFSLFFLYAHKDTFLHFIICVGGGRSLHHHMNKCRFASLFSQIDKTQQ